MPMLILRRSFLALVASALVWSGAPCAEAGAPALSQTHRDRAHKFSLKFFKDWTPVPVESGERYEVAKFSDPKGKGQNRGTFDPDLSVVRFVRPGSPAAQAVTPSDEPQLPEGIPPEMLERMGGTKMADAFDAAMRGFTYLLPENTSLPKQAFKVIESEDKVPGKLWVFDLPSPYAYPGAGKPETIFVTIGTFEKDGLEYAVRLMCGSPLRKDFEKPFVKVVESFKFFDAKAGEVESLSVLDGVAISPKRRLEIEKSMVKGWDVIVSPKKQYIVIYNTKNNTNHALAKLIAERIERIREQVYEVQFPPAAPITAVSICRVCKDRQDYMAYGGPGGSAGYWNSGSEELVFYDASASKKADADTLAVLYHEAFHQFIFYSVGEVAPHSWFNEGHGDYYAGARYANGKFKIEPFNWRVGTVRNAIVEGPRERSESKDEKTGEVNVTWGNTGYTPLQHLVAFSQGEYYSYPGVSYAQGWALIYFLREIVPANKKYAEKWGKILDVYFNTLKAGVNRPAPKPEKDEGDEDGKGKGDDTPKPPDAPPGGTPPAPPTGPVGPPKPPPGDGAPEGGEDDLPLPPKPPPGDGAPEGGDAPPEIPMFFGRGDPKALQKALEAAFQGVDWKEFEEAWIKATKSGK